MGNICIDCGICCTGVLFVEAGVEEGYDRRPLAAKGAVFTTTAQETVFSHPCPAFTSGCCSVYEVRPAVCRSFRCALLRKVEAEEVSADDARMTIASTRALSDRSRSRLEALVGDGRDQPLNDLVSSLRKQIETDDDPPAARVANAEVLADLAALDVMLGRHFRNPEPAPGQPTPSDGS